MAKAPKKPTASRTGAKVASLSERRSRLKLLVQPRPAGERDALSRALAKAGLKLLAQPLPPGERGALSRALAKASLAVDDLDMPGRLFWRFLMKEQVPVGFGGLELHGKDALLRSVLTLPPARKRGVGAAIVAALETEALIAGCRGVWIITTDAAEFFDRLGYAPCAREDVPRTIRETQQLASLCPASATVMVKRLR